MAGAAGLGPTWTRAWSGPSRPLLRFLDGGPSLSTAEVADRSAALAGQLAARGLGPGSRVAWMAERDPAAVLALVALLRLGCTVSPTYPGLSPSELTVQLEDLRPEAVLGPEGLALPAGQRWLGYQQAVAAAPATLDEAGGEDPALVVYTSGTTGRPKGVVHSHRSLLAGIETVAAAWSWGEDQLLHCLPLFHVHGLVVGLMGALASAGGALVAPRFTAGLVGAAAGEGATMLFGVPTMYHRLAAEGQAGALRGYRLFVSGSAALDPALSEAIALEAGQVPLERYGMTETLLTVSNPLEGERRPGSIGQPFPGVDVEIAGDGELLVRTPTMAAGILGDGQQLGLDERGFLATGDLATADDDGYLRISGRRSELIITGGFNVYPAEVEAVVATVPGVLEVAVVGQDDADLGQRIVAFVVAEEAEGLEARVLERCGRELARHRQPRAVVVVDELPRNAMGKVLRRELARW